MANHGPSYGLSRELEKKNQARFSLQEAQEVLQWIESVNGIAFDKEPSEFENAQEIADALKDGVALCILINQLIPSTTTGYSSTAVRYHKSPKMPFHKMENISNFLDACKAYGVPEISCFQTVDLYENKQCYKVIECLRSLAAVAQSKQAPVSYPNWVVKMAHNQPRWFPKETIRQGAAIIPLQYGTNKCASQKGMTPYGLARQITSDPVLSDVTAASTTGVEL
uniref:Transgelin n=1 Tax=Ditylenchus dipsaci TaxID=166011 RepID=A0A915CXR3_9BILA